jgi:ubiquinone/menaquinone biosynthesis C-methylase UbiE
VPGRIYDATWGRLFAWGYDWFLSSTEEAGLRDMRRELLADASGRCLEIGAGTGLNLDLWPEGVDRLVLSEPDPHMAKRLRKRVEESRRSVEVVAAGAEALPFEDDSFDTVALTLVLCTVPEPKPALREIDRVLAPGGRFLFLEHVRSTEPKVARWQDRLHGAWYLFGDGCHCNRDTLATIESSPLEVDHTDRGQMPKAPPIVRPMLRGAARAVPTSGS